MLPAEKIQERIEKKTHTANVKVQRMRQDAWSVAQLLQKGKKDKALEKEKKLLVRYSKNVSIFERILTEQKHKAGV